jgi:hypothetical protein
VTTAPVVRCPRMILRRLLVLAAALAAVGAAAPAHATLVCATVYRGKDATTACGPWGSPLPHLSPECPVSVPDLVNVCEYR